MSFLAGLNGGSNTNPTPTKASGSSRFLGGIRQLDERERKIQEYKAEEERAKAEATRLNNPWNIAKETVAGIPGGLRDVGKVFVDDPMKTLATPVIRAEQAALTGIGMATGNENLQRAANAPLEFPSIFGGSGGTIEPQRAWEDGGAKQIVGDTAKYAATVYTGGKVAPIAKTGFLGQITKAGLQGAKEGAIGGGLYMGGDELQRPDSTIRSTVEETAKGIGFGGGAGLILGAGGAALARPGALSRAAEAEATRMRPLPVQDGNNPVTSKNNEYTIEERNMPSAGETVAAPTGETKTIIYRTTKSGKVEVDVYANSPDSPNAGQGGAPEGKVWLETIPLEKARTKYQTTDSQTLAERIVNPHTDYNYQTETYKTKEPTDGGVNIRRFKNIPVEGSSRSRQVPINRAPEPYLTEAEMPSIQMGPKPKTSGVEVSKLDAPDVYAPAPKPVVAKTKVETPETFEGYVKKNYGSPLYHGTLTDVKDLKPGIGSGRRIEYNIMDFDTPPKVYKAKSQAVFFSEDKEIAAKFAFEKRDQGSRKGRETVLERYAKRSKTLDLSTQKKLDAFMEDEAMDEAMSVSPAFYDEEMGTIDPPLEEVWKAFDSKAFVKELQKMGYDSAVINEGRSGKTIAYFGKEPLRTLKDIQAEYKAFIGSAKKAPEVSKSNSSTDIGITSFRGKPVKTVGETAQYYDTARAKGFENSLNTTFKQYNLPTPEIEKAAGSWEGSVEPSFIVRLKIELNDDVRAYAVAAAKKANQDAVIFFSKGSGKSTKYTFKTKSPDKTLKALHSEGISGATVEGNNVLVYDLDGSLTKNIASASKKLKELPTKEKGHGELIFKDDYAKYTRNGDSVRAKNGQAKRTERTEPDITYEPIRETAPVSSVPETRVKTKVTKPAQVKRSTQTLPSIPKGRPVTMDIPKRVATVEPKAPKPGQATTIAKGARELNRKLVEEGYDAIPEDELAKIGSINKADQIEKTTRLLDDLPSAIRMAMRQEPIPDGVAPQVLFNAVKNHAKKTGDFELQSRLARSSILEERATAAQTLGSAGFNNDPVDAVAAIKEVEDVRIKAKERRRQVSDVKKEAKAGDVAIKKVTAKKTWDDVINSLTC